MKQIKIRKVRKKDAKLLLNLITELAEFEKLAPPSRPAQVRLIKDIFKKNSPLKVLVVEYEQNLIGYAFYFFTYSTFLARPSLYLEDIYITPKFRKLGVGTKIFDKLIKIAKSNKCGRIEFIVLKWNKNALKFYQKFNAKILKDWSFLRINL
ncbi:MAG: GNAT family N-acetyltransferase [Patescibacteria group bacterium]|nr:GNAT family N-acetyltransferase [Patescibacteria group bacterium]